MPISYILFCKLETALIFDHFAVLGLGPLHRNLLLCKSPKSIFLFSALGPLAWTPAAHRVYLKTKLLKIAKYPFMKKVQNPKLLLLGWPIFLRPWASIKNSKIFCLLVLIPKMYGITDSLQNPERR